MSRNFFNSKRLESQQKSSMSIQKPVKVDLTTSNSVKDSQNLDKVVSNHFAQRVHGLVQNSVDQTLKPTVVYTKTLPTQINGWTIQRKFIVFRQIDYIISGFVGTGYPNCIYIAHTAPVTWGFENLQGQGTKKLAVLQLAEISPCLDDAQVKVYDLRYTLKEGITWGIPPTITTLDLEIYTDDNSVPTSLPLPNPLTIACEFRYEKM